MSAQCEMLGVPRSTYYWMAAHPERPKGPDPLAADVVAAFERNNREYGAPRLKMRLAARSVVMDGATVLMRIGGTLADMPRLDAVSELCVGLSGPVLGRICRAREYLVNANEALASSDALMAKELGISAEALEYAMESEAAQAQVPEDDEDWIGGTLDEDRCDDTESDW